MVSKKDSNKARLQRHKRVRAKISGTAERPRLDVFRSAKNIYAQVIDDVAGVNPRIRLDCREELYRVRRQQGSSQEDWSDRCRALQG